jgi:hypothetical protein
MTFCMRPPSCSLLLQCDAGPRMPTGLQACPPSWGARISSSRAPRLPLATFAQALLSLNPSLLPAHTHKGPRPPLPHSDPMNYPIRMFLTQSFLQGSVAAVVLETDRGGPYPTRHSWPHENKVPSKKDCPRASPWLTVPSAPRQRRRAKSSPSPCPKTSTPVPRLQVSMCRSPQWPRYSPGACLGSHWRRPQAPAPQCHPAL